ncbi:hypothetical protein MTP99_006540 [Tenebrio molitor]|nr:hypothetical protein MTP99_006540 [Tenebrio molitor]
MCACKANLIRIAFAQEEVTSTSNFLRSYQRKHRYLRRCLASQCNTDSKVLSENTILLTHRRGGPDRFGGEQCFRCVSGLALGPLHFAFLRRSHLQLRKKRDFDELLNRDVLFQLWHLFAS